MTALDNAHAAIDALDADWGTRLAVVNATVVDLRAQVSTLTAQVNADAAQIATLQAELASYFPLFPGHLDKPRIGMAAPTTSWAQAVKDVGPGLSARRIYADLVAGGADALDQVQQAHADGMLPVISYKGNNAAYAKQAADLLEALGQPVAVVYHHEPNPELTAAQFVVDVKTLMPIFKRPNISRGCFLNGWMMDRKQAAFGTFCPDELMQGDYWDWFGVDCYQAGTMSAPARPWPGDRIKAVDDYLTARGYPDMPLAIGEYNAYEAAAIADAGERILSNPRMWLACMWNSTGGVGVALSGDRLAAFKATLADPRSA